MFHFKTIEMDVCGKGGLEHGERGKGGEGRGGSRDYKYPKEASSFIILLAWASLYLPTHQNFSIPETTVFIIYSPLYSFTSYEILHKEE